VQLARPKKLRVCRDNRQPRGELKRLLRDSPRLLHFLTRFLPLQLQHLLCRLALSCGSTAVLPLSIANTPKDLMCLQSAIAAEQCARLQLQNLACNCRTPHCNCRGSAAIRVCKCTLRRHPAQRRRCIVHYTPLGCKVGLELQMVVVHSRECKGHVWDLRDPSSYTVYAQHETEVGTPSAMHGRATMSPLQCLNASPT
jgi:hypothetical protein